MPAPPRRPQVLAAVCALSLLCTIATVCPLRAGTVQPLRLRVKLCVFSLVARYDTHDKLGGGPAPSSSSVA